MASQKKVRSNFACNLKSLRGQKTQKFMADQVGVSKGSYVRWEHALAFPQPSEMLILADYFDVTIDYLYGREQIENISEDRDLSIDESRLLNAYRSCNDAGKVVLLSTAIESILDPTEE